MPEIFISHSSRDYTAAGMLVELIRAALVLPVANIRCTSVEGHGLSCGVSTDDELKKEIKACKVFIALISESSMRSAYVLFELGARWAVSKPIWPVTLGAQGTALLNGPLSGCHALRATEPLSLCQLVADLGEALHLMPEPPAVYMQKVEDLCRLANGAEQ